MITFFRSILVALLVVCFTGSFAVCHAKTTAELIAEIEGENEDTASAATSLDQKTKSAAEIIAEIEALSVPSSQASETPEISTASSSEDLSITGDEALLATDTSIEEPALKEPATDAPIADEVIGEYVVDEDEVEETITVSEVEDLESETEIATSGEVIDDLSAKTTDEVASVTLYEKADALEPQLLLSGTPADDEDESSLSEKLMGMIIAEKKPLGRRRYVYRWVLKTEDGQRIPLKSNMKLLQEVRRENVLDSEVALTGRFIDSGFDEHLRYFVVESLLVMDEDKGENESAGESDEAEDGKKSESIFAR